ncbi:MAG: M48 family metallopeptidase [Sphingomonas sp.]|uniref:M48 family metallopeptidase n=1 Tax=Sphingomonas sp. TaxID=28214 RepID=UPI001B1F1ACB|nr:M48 family metallopeptidase [Sphingomonas sp.]MBO9624674.1 M48 family metallopeptidase [Sphingomonas sp.]
MRGGRLHCGLALALAPWITCQPAVAQRSFARPPYAGAYEPQGIDERGLWMEMDEDERLLQASPFVLPDPGLHDFVRGVLCRTVGEDRCRGVRVYVVKDSSFNASMAPNGVMFVHTGLLARLHSEAELATVLGHEFGHFEKRHTLAAFRSRRTTGDALAWVALLGAVTRRPTGAVMTALVAGHFRFERSEEVEADLLGVQFVRASGYPLRASAVWQRVIAEEDALRAERGLRKIRRETPSMMDTHPTERQRLGYFSRLEAEVADAGDEGVDGYRQATDRVLPVLFESLIKGNDFAGADYVLRSRGDALGWSGELLYLRAELYRQRGHPRDLVTAQDLFGQSIARADAPPESWRGLGLIAMRQGAAAEGRAALAEYLRRAPHAPDAAAVKMVMEN